MFVLLSALSLLVVVVLAVVVAVVAVRSWRRNGRSRHGYDSGWTEAGSGAWVGSDDGPRHDHGGWFDSSGSDGGGGDGGGGDGGGGGGD